MTTRTTTARDPSHQIHHRHPDTSLSSQHLLLCNRKISTSFVLPLIVANFVTVIVQCLEGRCSGYSCREVPVVFQVSGLPPPADPTLHPMSGNLPMLMRQEEERAGTSLDNYHRQTQCTSDLRSPSLPQNNLQHIAILEVLSHGEMYVVLVNMKWPQ